LRVEAMPEENHSHSGVQVSVEAVERDISGSEGVVRPEASQDAEVQTRHETSPEPNTSGPRQVESEAAPNDEATLNTEGPSTSRFRSAFKILSKGLLGCLEAIKNLIPEGFLGGTGATLPERIAQGIMISHYQVKLLE
jgi:hypothetical protein